MDYSEVQAALLDTAIDQVQFTDRSVLLLLDYIELLEGWVFDFVGISDIMRDCPQYQALYKAIYQKVLDKRLDQQEGA